MNGKAEFIVCAIIDLVLPKRDVADRQIIEVFTVCRLKTCNGDVCFGVKLLSDSTGDAVQLHAVELTFRHAVREKTKEIADTH